MSKLDDQLLQRIDDLLQKGKRLLATAHFASYRERVDTSLFSEWRSQSLEFLSQVVGPESPYLRDFSTKVDDVDQWKAETGQGILRAVKEDLERGYLTNLRTLVEAEVFTDFLDMADHLLASDYKDPAAFLCGAVLEDGLRRAAIKRGIKIPSKTDINSLNQVLAEKGVYNNLVRKQVQVWADIRNSADHGKFDEYSSQDVKAMHDGVTTFLAQFM